MHGSYEMRRLVDDEALTVLIPKFSLIAPFKLN
jgi:hypothetical protein